MNEPKFIVKFENTLQ